MEWTTELDVDLWFNGYFRLLERIIEYEKKETERRVRMKERTWQDKLDRIYDELWGMGETTGLSAKDDSDRHELLNLIDDILER